MRWFYGNARESISVEKRNINPNGSALTSNILKKKVLTLINLTIQSLNTATKI
jgi:hypothetical protein